MNNASSPQPKRKYLVETKGAFIVKQQEYEAADPDEAAFLAFRHEAFYCLKARYPMETPQRILAVIDAGRIEMPNFKVKKITLVPSEVKS